MSVRSSLAVLAATTGLAAGASAQITFQPATPYALQGFRPDSVATGDFNGANGIDFAVASSDLQGGNTPDRVEIFVNQGNGTFAPGQTVVLGNNLDAGAIVAADLDRDGDLDLAVTLKQTNSVRALMNAGGVFSLGSLVAVGGLEPAHMAAGDVDGDGDIDLVTSNRDSSNLSVLRNGGTGVLTLSGTLAVGTDPYSVVVDDLNGDCRNDLAVSAHDVRRIDVLLNQGAGTFAAPFGVTIPGNERPSGLVAADLDTDGDVDLATASDDNNLGIVAVLRNNGSASFTGQTFPSNGLNPDAIVAGDFDGDGDKDLATADEDANRVSVLPNLGNANYGAATIFAVGTHPDGLARADFDGNGSLDIVTANRDSNNASVLLNTSASGTDTYCVTTPNSAGYGARIDTLGSLSIGANSFTLLARCAPANVTGLFLFGNGTAFAPFGNGRRCVGAPLSRLRPPLTTDATGHAVRQVDFTTGAASAITPGSTRTFQFWHRDVAGGGAQTNASDALRATFRL